MLALDVDISRLLFRIQRRRSTVLCSAVARRIPSPRLSPRPSHAAIAMICGHRLSVLSIGAKSEFRGPASNCNRIVNTCVIAMRLQWIEQNGKIGDVQSTPRSWLRLARMHKSALRHAMLANCPRDTPGRYRMWPKCRRRRSISRAQMVRCAKRKIYHKRN